MTRSITPDDFYAIQHVEDPQLSPDGAQVVFVRLEVDRDAFEYRRSLWLAGAEGGEPRRLTNGPSDSAPRWSPDGASIAFLRGPGSPIKPKSREERERGVGAAQLWTLSMGGGEPTQLTHLRHGAGAAVWAPDGASIAFAAQTGDADDQAVDDAALDGKTLPRIRTITQMFHKLDGAGYIYELRSHLFIVPIAAGGAPRQVTDGDWDDGDPCWSPDGGHLAFTADRTDDRWMWPASQVWTVDADTGAAIRLTSEDLGAAGPSWSPDGATIAFTGSPRRKGVGHTDLYTTTPGASEPGQRLLTEAFAPTCSDSCIDDQRSSHGAHHLAWTPDSREIMFLASTRGATHVYTAPADGSAAPRALTSGPLHVYGYSTDSATRTLALGVSTPLIPGDLYVQTVEGEPRRMTELNASLFREVALAAPAEFSYSGADGWEMQGWIMRPAGAPANRALPAVLEIHGGPAAMYGESFFLEFQLLAARGYSVVYVNPRGSTGYGREFSGAVINDWGGKDYQDIMAGLDAAIARGGIDPERLGVAGGSYGGFMTNWATGHSDRFKAGITMRCVSNMATMFGVSDIGWGLTDDVLDTTPWEGLDKLMACSPITYVQNIHTPLLILHSDNDLRCPLEEAQQLYIALRYLGRETKLVIFEGQSHDLSRTGHPRSRVHRLNEIAGWFDGHLAG